MGEKLYCFDNWAQRSLWDRQYSTGTNMAPNRGYSNPTSRTCSKSSKFYYKWNIMKHMYQMLPCVCIKSILAIVWNWSISTTGDHSGVQRSDKMLTAKKLVLLTSVPYKQQKLAFSRKQELQIGSNRLSLIAAPESPQVMNWVKRPSAVGVASVQNRVAEKVFAPSATMRRRKLC